MTPDRIIVSLDRPYLATANDCIIFRESPIPKKIDKFWPTNRQKLYLLRDQVYGAIKRVISPFYGGVNFTGVKRTFNNQMSSIRISVEQAFEAFQQK